MRKYLTQTLGFHEENVLPLIPGGRVTYAELRTLIRQKLPSYVKEGTSEVFVYYSGHGAPSTGEDRYAYLVPSDTDPNFVSDDNAYRLSQFYEDLAALDAASVTVALDACFTGQFGSGDMMLRQASPLALSVENPLLGVENATGFLAAGRRISEEPCPGAVRIARPSAGCNWAVWYELGSPRQLIMDAVTGPVWCR